MYTINDLKDRIALCESHLNSLMSIYHDEVKEYGKAKDNTVLRINAMLYHISDSIESLDKGLNGDF